MLLEHLVHSFGAANNSWSLDFSNQICELVRPMLRHDLTSVTEHQNDLAFSPKDLVSRNMLKLQITWIFGLFCSSRLYSVEQT